MDMWQTCHIVSWNIIDVKSEIFFSKAPSIPRGGGDVEETKRELRAKMVITDFEEIRTTFYE